jgi:hypothetical protein
MANVVTIQDPGANFVLTGTTDQTFAYLKIIDVGDVNVEPGVPSGVVGKFSYVDIYQEDRRVGTLYAQSSVEIPFGTFVQLYPAPPRGWVLSWRGQWQQHSVNLGFISLADNRTDFKIISASPHPSRQERISVGKTAIYNGITMPEGPHKPMFIKYIDFDGKEQRLKFGPYGKKIGDLTGEIIAFGTSGEGTSEVLWKFLNSATAADNCPIVVCGDPDAPWVQLMIPNGPSEVVDLGKNV